MRVGCCVSSCGIFLSLFMLPRADRTDDDDVLPTFGLI